jgi:hypothetical protein
MDIATANKVLEDAVKRCMTDNVNTTEVFDALDFLRRPAAITWPFEHFRKSLAPRDGELDLNPTGRRQPLNASLNGMWLVNAMGSAKKKLIRTPCVLQIRKQD